MVLVKGYRKTILLASAIIACAILLSAFILAYYDRYSLMQLQPGRAYLVDGLTGDVWYIYRDRKTPVK